jgi:hypothetical protein
LAGLDSKAAGSLSEAELTALRTLPAQLKPFGCKGFPDFVSKR